MSEITNRKSEHIDIALNTDVSMQRSANFERYQFMHQALPELDLAEISTHTKFLGNPIDAPLLISSMTGGNERAEQINRNLAEAAQTLHLPMAVGSERIILEHPEAMASFAVVREVAPDIPIYGNLGAVQLNYGIGPEDVKKIVDLVRGNGIFLHLNPLQEAIQSGGNTNFRGLLDKIGQLAAQVDFPIIAKEVGCGISQTVALALAERGIAAIDVSGAGGTSWARIESLRTDDSEIRRLGEVFCNWGLPTVQSLELCRATLPGMPLIASGGIRSGLDVAKALALGADIAAFAMPLLAPAARSSAEVVHFLHQIETELRMTMFLIGVPDIPTLRKSRHLLKTDMY